MPRLYHSASSIELAKRCPRAWAYSYIGGLREPEISWAEIEAGAEHTSRQRSTALGKAMHAVLEGWYRHEPVDWNSFPGQVALSGAHLLPHPTRVFEARVEEAIGDTPITNTANPDGPQRVMYVDGVPWAGFRDLLVLPYELEAARLELPPEQFVLTDYKSSANIERYALTPEELRDNTQANLYAIDVCRKLGTTSTPARWVYFETKRTRRAKPVDVVLELSRAEDVIQACNTLAREVDSYTRIEDAPCNPAACGDYGGCSYHKSAGGPCDARRSIGALIQARVKKKDTTMPLSPEAKAKFEAAKARREASQASEPPPAKDNTPDTAAAPDGAEPPPAEPPPATPTPAPAPKPKAKAKAAGVTSNLVELATELAQLDARRAEVVAAMREALQ